MKRYEVHYLKPGSEASIEADRLEDNGDEIVLYIPKKYVAWVSKFDVSPLQAALR